MGLIIHVDGGSRGNPGPAGAGVLIATDDGRPVFEAGYWLGKLTNNAAEYHALIRALQRVNKTGERNVSICSDSELLVRQVTGDYRVKSPTLAALFEQVQMLLLRIPCWQIRHVRREENRRADELANMAMDRQADVVVFDIDAGGQAAESRPPASGAHATPASPAPAALDGEAATASHTRAVRVALVHGPQDDDACPAGGAGFDVLTLVNQTPPGMCLHAAHAILPTLLAIQNTESEEFAAVPTLTVRCNRGGCGATFHLSPEHHTNGR